MIKKILAGLIVVCILISGFCTSFTALAATINKGKISIATESAKPGDEQIKIPIKIEDNPGIMAITLSINYDSDVLEYKGYSRGKVVNDYTVAAHPDKNIIRFVSGMFEQTDKNGEMITLKFNVKDNAKAGLSKIDIECGKGDMCNEDLDNIMPKISAGGVKVAFTGDNCSHEQYENWNFTKTATCETKGSKERTCRICGYKDKETIAPLGHEYTKEWTIDKEATETKAGSMSRHCKRCDKKTDITSFTLKQSEEGNIDNTVGSKTPVNDYTEEIFKEQHPDKELTPNNPPPVDIEDEEAENTLQEESALQKLKNLFSNYSTACKIAIFVLLSLIKL